MWQAFERALDEFAADDEVRVVVLSGAGDKAFVSGADISKFEDERSSAEAVAHYDVTTARIFGKLHAFPKPTIAQITGSCVGGGVALAVCCDLRICGAELALRHPGGEARARLRLRRAEAPGRPDRPGLRQGDVLHRAPVLRRRGVRDGPGQPRAWRMARSRLTSPTTRATIAANAPLTVGAAKAIVGEVLKDPAERDLARCEELVARVLRQPRLRRGPRGLPREAPAAVHRRLRPARRVTGVRAPAPPRSSAAPAPGTGAARP